MREFPGFPVPGIPGQKPYIQCTAASSAVLKGRSYDLIELKPAGEYLKHKKNVTVINTLIKDWIKKAEKDRR